MIQAFRFDAVQDTLVLMMFGRWIRGFWRRISIPPYSQSLPSTLESEHVWSSGLGCCSSNDSL